MKNFYLTTTLPYVNAPLHMGHALELIRADTLARYKMLSGYEVFFNTGTDEHGKKNYDKALQSGLSPKEFVDRGFEIFKDQIKMFGVTEDVHFIRTTDPHHKLAAQEFWRRVKGGGFIYKKNYEAKYCVGCESEKTDSELDENGECPLHPGLKLEKINEENYFFKLSAFQDKLLELYARRPDFVVPNFRMNEIVNFVKNGLQDFSVSRLKVKMPWGIEVPDDPDHVMYVWFDALTNYISTLGWPYREDLFQKFWVNGNPTQYCGKDNTRFQAVTWQAMLFAAGLPNSYQIVVNGFVTADGGVRMSKTLGNVIDPRDVVEEYGTDALRYFLLREISSFEDGPFTMERFRDAYNANLANGLGNLVSRVLTLSEKYLDKCPEIPESEDFSEYFAIFETFDLKKACDYVWERITELDMLIQKEEPFKVAKTDLEKSKIIIKDMVLKLYSIARMLNPLLPQTSTKLKQLIRENKKPENPLFPRKD